MKHSHITQQFHPGVKIGSVPFVTRGRKEIPIHCEQGAWDSACGAHCAAIALAILGHIHDVSVLSERRNGVAARLWKAAKAKYFDGVNVVGLSSMLDSVDIPRKVAHYSGSHLGCVAYILSRLARQELVIASWRSRQGHNHWILIVGMEGIQSQKTLVPSALLALDPGATEPLLCAYNGRLELLSGLKKSSTWRPYITSSNQNLIVRLTSAVALGSLALGK